MQRHGAVRHAAENVNYYFPQVPEAFTRTLPAECICVLLAEFSSAPEECCRVQELDPEFLVLWHGYDASRGRSALGSHRRYLSPAELCAFLVDRVADGYSFPLNPVWPIRDPGWYEVLQTMLKQSPEAPANMKAEAAGITVEELRRRKGARRGRP